MKQNTIEVMLENQRLKSEFAARGLDLSQVFFPAPDDPARENAVLNNLLDWVDRYTECRDRQQMESEGYTFPPIDPCISPEDDWYRFKCWLKGRPICLKLRYQLPLDFKPTPPDQLTDDEIHCALENLSKLLAEIRVLLEFHEDVPPRLKYEQLLETLNEDFDISIEGYWHLNGCSGYCPGCFQRPWCELGNQSCWKEDEEAGRMFLCKPVQRYVSASPSSLIILRKFQDEEDICEPLRDTP